VLIPIPALDFDPTEAAVSWRVLTGRGHQVLFATPDGRPGAADALILTGEGLDPWGWIPGLKKLPLIGAVLRADANGRAAYAAMQDDPAFRQPMTWDGASLADFDGLLLPGGHRARGMRSYLESPVLQRLVVQAFAAGRPVGAICHGVVLAARSWDPATGRSVLFGRKTTALTWRLERTADAIARVARFWDGGYYRTYSERPGQPAGFMSVQQEVTRALASPDDFLDAPPTDRRKSSGTVRDTPSDASPAFVVRDGPYVSARWPGDAHGFAAAFAEVLEEAAHAQP
jgi:putative intracellular protease/amidase